MKYFYTKDNEKIGPLDIDGLKQAKIDDNTLIWYSGLEKWTMLKNIPELKELLYTNNTSINYYLMDDGEKIGPFDIEELKTKQIKPSTLIWHKELDHWIKAKNIEELERYIVPDLPTEEESDTNIHESLEEESVKKVIKAEPNNNSKNQTAFNTYNSGSFFQRPLSPKGRIGRMEYFVTSIIFLVIYIILNDIIIDIYDETALLFILVLMLFNIYFLIVNTAKRCHDIGNSGWYQLIPFYSLYLFFPPGEEKENRYGNNPSKKK